MSLSGLARSEFLNGRVKLLFVGNVFGDPGSNSSHALWEDEIFKKFHDMLVEGGKVVIWENHTPDVAAWLRNMQQEFSDRGFEAAICTDESSVRRELEEIGFPEETIEAFGGAKWDLEEDERPFVIVLKKSAGQS